MNVEPIELTTSDQIILRGQEWAGGEHWVVLFHDFGHDLDCWQPLMLPLLGCGYTLLTVDLRGHGASEGEWDAGALDRDLDAAVAFARGRGAVSVAFIGAGESALPALTPAFAKSLRAMVLISPGPLGGRTLDTLRGEGVPKMFVVGSFDPSMTETMRRIRDRSIGWAMAVRLPTEDQGSALLAGPWGRHIQESVVAFLEEQRYSNGVFPGPAMTAETAQALLRRLYGG